LSIDVIPARPEMANVLTLQGAQMALGQYATPEHLAAAMVNGFALAVVDGSRILAIGGVQTVWEDRGNAWGLLTDDIAYAMPIIHKTVLRVLDTAPHARVEAQVAAEHETGQRWVRMLRFHHEGTMRRFFQGRDYDLFSRVK
jgi:hypothetical protein